MSTAVQKVSSNRSISSSIVIDTNNGSLGTAVTISAAANFSIEPGVDVTNLTTFYNVYLINTASDLTLTLPTSINTGWRCKIILNSTTGSLSIFSVSTTYALLTSTLSSYAVADLTFTNTVASPWKAVVNYTPTTDVSYYTFNNNSLAVKNFINIGRFFSFSGATPVDVNNSTLQAIPWEFASSGRYVDPVFFNPTPVSNTRIQFTRAMTAKITAGVFISSTGGASLTGFTINFYVDGSLSTISSSRNQSSVSTTTNFVSETNLVYSGVANYLELKISKSPVTAGTNPTVPGSMYVLVEVMSY